MTVGWVAGDNYQRQRVVHEVVWGHGGRVRVFVEKATGVGVRGVIVVCLDPPSNHQVGVWVHRHWFVAVEEDVTPSVVAGDTAG